MDMRIPPWVIGGAIASAILAPIYAAQRKKHEAEEKELLAKTAEMTQSWVDGMSRELREKGSLHVTHPISGESIQITPLTEEEASE